MGRVILVSPTTLSPTRVLTINSRFRLQDLPNDQLLFLTCSIPLSLLLLVYLVPKLSQLVLPNSWIRTIKQVSSSPVKAEQVSTTIIPSQQPHSDDSRDRKLIWLITLGGLESIGWLIGAVYVLIKSRQAKERVNWITPIELALISLGWVSSSSFLFTTSYLESRPTNDYVRGEKLLGTIFTLVVREKEEKLFFFSTFIEFQFLLPTPIVPFPTLHFSTPTP